VVYFYPDSMYICHTFLPPDLLQKWHKSVHGFHRKILTLSPVTYTQSNILSFDLGLSFDITGLRNEIKLKQLLLLLGICNVAASSAITLQMTEGDR